MQYASKEKRKFSMMIKKKFLVPNLEQNNQYGWQKADKNFYLVKNKKKKNDHKGPKKIWKDFLNLRKKICCFLKIIDEIERKKQKTKKNKQKQIKNEMETKRKNG